MDTEECMGFLKVIVLRGKRLAIRDFTSSDPYVVLKLGTQTAKTKVINSCLNPVWNEEFIFSVTEPVGILKLEVFDKDRFKSDDKMGHTFLNLQWITSAVRLRNVLRPLAGETKIRKVVPSSDNCLSRESYVTCVDGEIMQAVCLKLLDVESGELDLHVKWMDFPPAASNPVTASVPNHL